MIDILYNYKKKKKKDYLNIDNFKKKSKDVLPLQNNFSGIKIITLHLLHTYVCYLVCNLNISSNFKG